MGSDNSGKRVRTGRLLVPGVALAILIVGGVLFYMDEEPKQKVATRLDNAVKRIEGGGMQGMRALNQFVDNQKSHLRKRLARPESSEGHVGAPRNPVASIEHILTTFQTYLRQLHRAFGAMMIGDNPELSAEGHDTDTMIAAAWDTFLELTNEYLLPLDTEFSPPPLDSSGNTVFMSVAAYRDENCPNTLTDAFKQAERPDGLYVGLVEQNCYQDCKTGVLKDLTVRPAGPDVDCVQTFCDGEMGRYCDHLRVLRINESESLGPAMARYFASKLWKGESFYIQIDAHSFFAKGWDSELKEMVRTAERPKPIITNYPPPDGWKWQNSIGLRMCDGYFTQPGIEAQIVRLEGSSQMDHERPKTPRFAPYIAAGFFFVSGQFLIDVPFDPYVPWIFMGEEIMLSSRAFTNGYHIFSPTINVLAHIYVRRNKPKFWETVGRTFKRPGFHNRLNAIVIRRVKNILGYPECDDELLWPSTLNTQKGRYGMGRVRTLDQYLRVVGLDPVAKTNRRLEWCHKGETPPELLELEREEREAVKRI